MPALEVSPLKLSRISMLLAATLLTACSNTNVKSQPEPLKAEPAVEPAGAAAPAASVAPTSPGSITVADFERLESRFSLAQEQLLGLITESAQTRALNQRILLQLQALNNNQAGTEPVDGGLGGYDTSAMDAVLEQMLMVANDLGEGVSSSGGNNFQMAMTYIGAGKWKVIRYNRSTGETWLAHGNNWQLLQDDEVLPESSYQVSMISGEDLLVPDEGVHKGFIAARMDRVSGRMWWLNKNVWQAYSE